MYPAKFTFSPSGPDCSIDFVVYPVNVAGSTIQPNIVAFNNLYSGGTSGTPTGLCGSRTVVSGDDRSLATTLWSYNIQGIVAGGRVPTSPALSLDGFKVAFVESAPAQLAHFHVLAWKSGDGVDITTPNAQNVLKPVTISSGFSTVAPAAGSGTVTDLVLGSTADTLSSPFVDYVNDVAYVGNDNGVLFRIKNVFCTLSCTVGVTPAPSLDTTWPTSGATALTGTLNVCSGNQLTGPVKGGSAGNIYVGCSDGKLYAFTPGGVALTNSPLTVGDGSTFGGIRDPALVDVTNGFVYVVSMSGSVTLGVTAGTPVLVQAKADLSSNVAATFAAGGFHNLHAPVVNNAYKIGSGTPLVYEVAPNTGTGGITLYGVGFTSFPVMNSGAPGSADQFAVGGAFEISPLTEFFDGTEDRFFESFLNASSGNLASFRIDLGFPGGLESSTSEGSGTTGIVIDNASASSQADSIYFGVLGSNTAVKATQAGLN
jgi:hypothetical protein